MIIICCNSSHHNKVVLVLMKYQQLLCMNLSIIWGDEAVKKVSYEMAYIVQIFSVCGVFAFKNKKYTCMECMGFGKMIFIFYYYEFKNNVVQQYCEVIVIFFSIKKI
eukprot:TRINITY_DN2874_c0_g2_i2.p2 TRINITY_DN2874_c0_g2~~TRINITY_DN2874_c0_g2_i2.p2  ORF type:complete len:107 (-),score=3.73 TRINITY_DN2874_c0_g2_i2:89-409(-)